MLCWGEGKDPLFGEPLAISNPMEEKASSVGEEVAVIRTHTSDCVTRKLKGLKKLLGTSYAGFEVEVVGFLKAIEGEVAGFLKLLKGSKELKILFSTINYESSSAK